MLFSYLTLFTALIISVTAAVYSILGLTAIFAAAFWPIVIMGGSLEVGKIVATLWLHKYWDRAEIQYKAYLCVAVAILMMLTSMGVFGFLSKAHGDQSLVSGDSAAKIAIYDEKIKISRENIDANRRALKQMDEAVDQVMSRSTDEKGADKAVAIRRGQATERTRLLKEIEVEQKKITALNEERAPLAAENRKIEAEVGPVKYIAALIYGDNPDANILEKAVRWVIILIVIVFDPLALTLLLAATKAIEWERGVNIFNTKKRNEDEETSEEAKEIPDENKLDSETKSFFQRARERAKFWDKQPKYEPDDGPLTEEQWEQLKKSLDEELPKGKVIHKDTLFPTISDKELGEWDDFFKGNKSNQEIDKTFFPETKLQPDPLPQPTYVITDADEEEPEVLRKDPATPGWMFSSAPSGDITSASHFGIKESVAPKSNSEETPVVEATVAEQTPVRPAAIEQEEDELTKLAKAMWIANNPTEIIENVHAAHEAGKIDRLPWHSEDHINYLPISDGERKRLMEQFATATSTPVSALQPDNTPPLLGTVTGFGIEFPKTPVKGDMFLRVDQLPTVLYKFNGKDWMQVDKTMTDSYAYDNAYIDHLIDKIASGEYDLDLLSDAEREQMALRLKDQRG